MIHGLAVCAGIGGLELGVQGALGPQYRCVCWIERDPAAVRVLTARMHGDGIDRAPIFDDVCTFDGRPWRGLVDLVTAGFPCQPFSTASRGRRVTEDLWPHVRRVVLEVEPRGVFLENVQPGPIQRAARDLLDFGYRRVLALRTTSAELGAPHRRVRWWLFADLDDAAESIFGLDAEVARIPAASRACWEKGPGSVLGMDDGVSGRVVGLRLLGNAVMPAMAADALARLLG